MTAKKVLYASTDRHIHFLNYPRKKLPRRYLAIVVYETRAEMLKAARRHVGNAEFFEDNCMAVFHPLTMRVKYGKGGEEEWRNGKHYIGTMRVNLEDVDAEIVIHETVHAACAIYRADMHSTVHLGDDCGYREETLAYIVGDLAEKIVAELVKHDCWPLKGEK